MAGFTVRIFGYFRCVSNCLEGIFLSRISPFTQTAVTQSFGVIIVKTLIYLERFSRVGLK